MPDQVSISASGPAPGSRVWSLLANPAQWPAWAPHMRHITGDHAMDAPGQVRVGQDLRVHAIVPGVSISVTVTAVEEGVSWSMRARLPVGQMQSGHTVTEALGATVATVTLRWTGPRLLGAAVLRAYRPVAALSLRRLLRVAEAEERGEAGNFLRMCHTHPAART